MIKPIDRSWRGGLKFRLWVKPLSLILLGVMTSGCQSFGSVSMPWSSTDSAATTRADVPPLGIQPESKPVALPKDKAAQACLLVAESLEANEHFREAILQYELARQYQPQLPGLDRKLGRLYEQAGDYDKALAEYEKVLKASPQNAELMNDVGYIHWRKGNGGEAEKWFRQALALQPSLKRAQINLGLALGQQGKFDESLAAFRVVLPEAESRCNLAFIHLQQGRVAEARQEYRMALALNPQLQLAKDRLADLERVEMKIMQSSLAKSEPARLPQSPMTSTSAPSRLNETKPPVAANVDYPPAPIMQVDWRPAGAPVPAPSESTLPTASPRIRLGLPQQMK